MSLELPVDEILAAAPVASGTAGGRVIGRSRQGREIVGYRFGSGAVAVSLIGGCHADEPVGPAMLERLAAHLASLPAGHPVLAAARWSLVPRVNPDGDAANAPWAEPLPHSGGYPLAAYLGGARREPPGDDVEFGFPRHDDDLEARPENRAVAAFLAAAAPFHLHITFHGMAFAAGPWFLIEEGWIERTAGMREALRRRVRALGYRPHDVDRRGEKGFTRIDEGFTTRPDSRAMQRFFEERDDPDTAALFRPSSMELVRRLGGDPLTMVSEMPLLTYDGSAGGEGDDAVPLPTDPPGSRRFVAWAHAVRHREGAEELTRRAEAAGIRSMPVADQMRLQMAMIEEGLEAVANA